MSNKEWDKISYAQTDGILNQDEDDYEPGHGPKTLVIGDIEMDFTQFGPDFWVAIVDSKTVNTITDKNFRVCTCGTR